MNILDYKRKAAGYFYRGEGGDGGQNEFSQLFELIAKEQAAKNQKVAEAIKAAEVTQASVRKQIAAKYGVPENKVEVTYGTKGEEIGDRYREVEDPSVITGYKVVNPNNTVSIYDPQGTYTQTYTPRRGDDLFGNFFADLDETLGLSKGVTSVSNALANLDKDLKLSENAPVIVGLAASYFLPGVGQALGQSLVNAGVLTGAAATPAMATTIGTALAQTGVSVAQGKPLDKALGDAIISAGVGGLTQAYGSDVKSAISKVTDNPIAQKAIFKAGTDVVSAVAQGKSGDEVLQGIGRSVASTVAGAAANEAVKNIPGIETLSPAQQNVVKSGIAASIQGGDGTKSMLNTALREGTNYVLGAVTSTPITSGTAGTTGAMQGGFGDASKLTDEQIQDIITGGQTSLGPSPTNQEILDSIGYTGPELSDDEIQDIITGGGTSLGPSPTNQEILDAIGYEPTEDVTLGSGILGSDKSGAAGEVPLSELPLTDVGSFGPVVEVMADGYPSGSTGKGGKGIGGGGGGGSGGAKPTALPAKSSPADTDSAFAMPRYQTTTTVTKPGDLVGAAGWATFEGNAPIDYTPFSYEAPEKVTKNLDGTIKMAHGGSVDELLAMLHSQNPESAGAGQTFDNFLASLR